MKKTVDSTVISKKLSCRRVVLLFSCLGACTTAAIAVLYCNTSKAPEPKQFQHDDKQKIINHEFHTEVRWNKETPTWFNYALERNIKHKSKLEATFAVRSVWDSTIMKNLFLTKCLHGQNLTNMPPICGASDCLPDLSIFPPFKLSRQSDSLEKMGKIKGSISKINGWMIADHVDLVHYLSEMQWAHGVYGLVGEIGVYQGKFATALAQYTDTKNGERFFVCDIFNKTQLEENIRIYDVNVTKNIFFKNMEKIGFSVDNADPAKRLYVWYASASHLSKNVFLQMKLSSARMISIDGYHHTVNVYNDLIQVMCVLRRGGIVIIDDIFNAGWPEVNEGVKIFNEEIGSNILKPIIYYANKLYLTTVDWYDTYMEYLMELDNSRPVLKKLNLVKKTLDCLGFLSCTLFSS